MTEIQILLTNWMSALAVLLPFGYSFGAGMVSTVNPCGFSMLPAYLVPERKVAVLPVNQTVDAHSLNYYHSK